MFGLWTVRVEKLYCSNVLSSFGEWIVGWLERDRQSQIYMLVSHNEVGPGTVAEYWSTGLDGGLSWDMSD